MKGQGGIGYWRIWNWSLGFGISETEDRRQGSGVRGQRTENRGQRTEDRIRVPISDIWNPPISDIPYPISEFPDPKPHVVAIFHGSKRAISSSNPGRPKLGINLLEVQRRVVWITLQKLVLLLCKRLNCFRKLVVKPPKAMRRAMRHSGRVRPAR